MNNVMINNLGSALLKGIEDQRKYDDAKKHYDIFVEPYLPDDRKSAFPYSYSGTDRIGSLLKGLMRNWGMYHQDTGLYIEPIIDEYVMEDVPIDFGVRFTKEFK